MGERKLSKYSSIAKMSVISGILLACCNTIAEDVLRRVKATKDACTWYYAIRIGLEDGEVFVNAGESKLGPATGDDFGTLLVLQ